MKRRISNILLAAVLVSTWMLSLALPVAALDPHEDPEAVTPDYSAVSFYLFSIEYLDYITSTETFDTNVFLNKLSIANLPPSISQATIDLILDSNNYTVSNFAFAELISQIQMSLTTGHFEQVASLATQAQGKTEALMVSLHDIELGIIDIGGEKESTKTVSESDLSRLEKMVEDRIGMLHDYINQRDELTKLYIKDSEDLANLEAPSLDLKVLPDNAFVGEYIGFQGDLMLNGESLPSRRISIQSDGINIATAYTNAAGHYQGTLQIPERYVENIILQAIYIPPETDARNHLPALSQEVPVRLRYHSVTLSVSLDSIAYPGRDLKLGLELDYAGAPPLSDRLVEIYLDDDLVSTSRIDITAPEILIGIDPEARIGPHLLTVVLPAAGRYAPTDRVELLDVQRAPLTLELERPTLAYLPGTVRYRGRVTSEIGPVAGAAVTLKLGISKVTTVTNSEGGFGAEFEIGFAGGLVGRQPMLVQVIPEQPWHKRLSETRHQVVVNLVNCILLGFFILVIGVYLPTRVDFRAMRRGHAPQVLGATPPLPLPSPMPELKWVEKSPPKAMTDRVIYWYRRTLYLVRQVTGMSPGAGQTLREFALTVSRGLGPLGRPFLDLTRLVERLTYSPYRANKADADFGESLTRRIDESIVTSGSGGDDAGT